MKVTSKMCMLKDLGMNGRLFGGNMLAWADEAAAIFAHKITREPHMVTLKFGEIVFKKPVMAGDIIEFWCTDEKVGNTSVTFNLKSFVLGESVFETSCVFVAVDKHGNKKKIDNPMSDKPDLNEIC